MDNIQGFEDLIHAILVLIHRANSPHIVIFCRNAILCWERTEGSHSLKSHQLLGELVFDENSTLRGAKVGSALPQRLAIKGLVNYAYSGSSVDCHTDHARDMIQMAFREAFCAIKWVNPNDHLFLKKLVRELIIVVVSFRRRHSVNLLHLLQILPVAVPLHIVVLNEHLLANMVLVELVRHDIGPLSRYLINELIFFTNDRCSRVKLGQIVHHCVLNVNVDLSEDVLSIIFLLHRDVGET